MKKKDKQEQIMEQIEDFAEEFNLAIGTVFFLIIFIIALAMLFSWAFTGVIVALICWCFSIDYTMKIGTGVWLLLILVWNFIPTGGNN